MQYNNIFKRITVLIVGCITLFLGTRLYLTGSIFKIYKLKEDISRVGNYGYYNLTMDQLVTFLKEIAPKAEVNYYDKDSHKKDSKNYYTYTVYLNGSKITGYSTKENGKLRMISINSGKAYIRYNGNLYDYNRDYRKPLSFEKSVIKKLEKNARILSNIINSSETQSQFNSFANKNLLGDPIHIDSSGFVGNSNIILTLDERTLLITFFPKENSEDEDSE
ncbi:hypothetical protein [Fusobacterium sp. PH5-44]|uniref:hypothetical protein n=1 Tax=unclassified Fusobacterium TaxID=2648384 RepID=UPI003D19AFD9